MIRLFVFIFRQDGTDSGPDAGTNWEPGILPDPADFHSGLHRMVQHDIPSPGTYFYRR